MSTNHTLAVSVTCNHVFAILMKLIANSIQFVEINF